MVWVLRFFLMKPNNCSIGLSQGEYSALNSTFTFILRQVYKTIECLWMTALSIIKTMFLWLYLGSLRMLLKVWYTKFSNSAASTPPSMIYVEITWSWLMAAINDTEYCCLLVSIFRIANCMDLYPNLPNCFLSYLWAWSYMDSWTCYGLASIPEPVFYQVKVMALTL